VARPLISIDGLCKVHRYGAAKVHALREASFELHAGEFVAIMGPSGSGKSTLLNTVGMLDRPTRGSYVFDGKDVMRLDDDQCAAIRCRRIGFVFQSFNLLGRSTASENVELPLIYAGVGSGERQRRVMVALDAVRLSHRREHWPGRLSGGEQQRVAIARALVNDPLLILADEPTGALDSATSREVLSLLQGLNRTGRTILLVTHDPEVAGQARRVIRLQDGRLIQDEPVTPCSDAGARPSEQRAIAPCPRAAST
jgi:putative ABC transport system ATP-binding protein